MTSWTRRIPALALSAIVLCGGSLFAADPAKKAPREVASFGTLRTPDADAVKAQAQDWLKTVGKTDEATMKSFATIWATDRSVLDKVSETFVLGDADAAKLLAEARDPDAQAPTETPKLLKDKAKSDFYRANLGLAYAKALSNRKVYEECLDALRQVKAEQVVDPATYFFHKAVAEHALMLRPEATDSIARLLDDVTDSPERYKMVSVLMAFDMATWQDKDLGWIARKMDNIQRRLELNRGGKATQKIQKEVLVRLDEMIKEKENQKNGSGSNGGNCPGGGSKPNSGPASGNTPSSPASETALPTGEMKGIADAKAKLKELAEVWGNLPEKERAKAMLELTRTLDPKYKDAVEIYLKEITIRSVKD
jgi:tetratricopeptide (TPR) repeat protein